MYNAAKARTLETLDRHRLDIGSEAQGETRGGGVRVHGVSEERPGHRVKDHVEPVEVQGREGAVELSPEVAAIAQQYSVSHGSENGIYLCASMPLGQPSKFGNKHVQNRVIQKGDQIALLVEDNGPGGMYTELGRSCVVGVKVPQAMKDELAFVIEGRKLTLDLLKPGTPSKDVWDGFNAFMRKNGRPMEARLYCHG